MVLFTSASWNESPLDNLPYILSSELYSLKSLSKSEALYSISEIPIAGSKFKASSYAFINPSITHFLYAFVYDWFPIIKKKINKQTDIHINNTEIALVPGIKYTIKLTIAKASPNIARNFLFLSFTSASLA